MKFISAMRTPVREISAARAKMFLLDAVAAAVLLALDQFTKHLAILRLKGQPSFVLIEGVLEFTYLENRGSAFSLFQDRRVFILCVGFLVMGAVFFVLLKLPCDKRFRIAHVLLSALAAGALGNMVDRMRFGFVVDFISFVLIHFPVFNAADCYIVVCTFGLFYLFLFVYKEEELTFLRFGREKR